MTMRMRMKTNFNQKKKKIPHVGYNQSKHRTQKPISLKKSRSSLQSEEGMFSLRGALSCIPMLFVS